MVGLNAVGLEGAGWDGAARDAQAICAAGQRKTASSRVEGEEIRRLAYGLWIQEGCPAHCDLAHWFRAEGEVRSQQPPARMRVCSGVGALWLEEQELQSAIESGIGGAAGRQAAAAVRILTFHYANVETIIALLSARTLRLVVPQRFIALANRKPRRSAANGESTRQIAARIAVLHRNLGLRLGSLSGRSTETAVAPLLSRAAQQHEAMARSLNTWLATPEY